MWGSLDPDKHKEDVDSTTSTVDNEVEKDK
jgi:hypothetical protein